MKKFNSAQLLKSFVIEFVVVFGALVAAFIGMGAGAALMSMMVGLVCAALVIALIIFLMFNIALGGSEKKAKKTFDEGLEANNFKNPSTFKGDTEFVAIDSEDGRVAYVSRNNNKEFQIANSNELTDIKSDYVHGPLGGTTGVYFEFKCRGKKTRVYTFIVSNGAVSLKNEKAMEGISKADYYADMLKNFATA